MVAPDSIKNFGRQQLYSFRRRKEYEKKKYKILPDGYINEELIEEHWDDILRFVATIKLKVTSASQLFKRGPVEEPTKMTILVFIGSVCRNKVSPNHKILIK